MVCFTEAYLSKLTRSSLPPFEGVATAEILTVRCTVPIEPANMLPRRAILGGGR